MTNKSAPEEFPLDEIDLLVGCLPKQLPWSVSGCSTRRKRIAFVTSLRRFWLKQGHRPEIAPSISSAAETAGMRGYVIDIVWSVIDTPKLESLGGTENPKWRP